MTPNETMITLAVFFLVLHKLEAFTTISSSSSSNSNSVLRISRSRSSALHGESFDISSLLYAEHEKLLVSRGQLEAQLMANTHSPLEPNVVKGSGGGGGFGGGTAAKGGGGSKKSMLKTQAKSHAKVLKEQGVVRIDNVLDGTLADSIRQTVYETRAESEQLVQDGSLPNLARFADVLLKENRCDMTIPIGPTWVAEALQSILLQSPVGLTMQQVLGKDAILYELSCLMSDPGSHRQVAHPDTPWREESVLYTCFVALQDVTLDMGPTTWLPNTHTEEMHARFQDESGPKDVLLQTQPSVLGTFSKGSCAIFDSRLLHCGGANTSEMSRALLYFSFQNADVVHVGNPGSIRPDLIGQWTLQQLEKELERYSKGKTTERLVASP
jgi:ectoine hydroxylase-related dioxygenase (phytanoyl-CoA dioxygenase family)